ncbi:hypothetical protein B0T17DRAFT_603395 [Bombardia bombarda]|uniref:Uncharacterized protein n=1 Tax=Bombardia bombarda TaxID=252184 RepID=A0AA39TGI7_9PEZI|nr:hypothetical protein B0T17DRAFT_603395 [Bombardia bombarda]
MDKDLEKQIQTEANGGQSWTIRRPTLNKRWTNWGSMSDTPHRALSTESSDVPRIRCGNTSVETYDDPGCLVRIESELLLAAYHRPRQAEMGEYSGVSLDVRALDTHTLLVSVPLLLRRQHNPKRPRGCSEKSLKSDRRATQHDGSTVRESIDKLLLVVCTTPLFSSWGQKNIAALPGNLFPVSARDLDDQLQERDTYSARDDFPVFGKRLLTLQHHNLRQQPSKMRDLWRDRRNPLQWYTFWAVFLVGGISIVLSLLQLAVSAAQLYIAVRAPNGS